MLGEIAVDMKTAQKSRDAFPRARKEKNLPPGGPRAGRRVGHMAGKAGMAQGWHGALQHWPAPNWCMVPGLFGN